MTGKKDKKHTCRGLLAGGILTAAAAACGGSVYLAHQLAKPAGKTLAQEREWEIEQELWGDFDQTVRNSYTVSGKDDYTLHCEQVLTDPKSRKYVILTHGYTSNRYGMV